MLKKLFKHEFYALFRSLFPVYILLFALSVISRISMFFSANNNVAIAFQAISTMFFVLTIMAVFIVSVIIIVTRFYKNLLSSEGYLSFSLPVKTEQHIICKAITATVIMIINIIAVFLALLILGIGTGVIEMVFEEIGIIFSLGFVEFGAASVILAIAEFALIMLICIISSMLMFYAAMSIGQQFKNRILGSVIAYIVLYMVIQMVMAVTILPFMAVSVITTTPGMAPVAELPPLQMMMTYGAIIGGLNLALATGYFFITRHFLGKKLNLE